jgi:hypothetical protein
MRGTVPKTKRRASIMERPFLGGGAVSNGTLEVTNPPPTGRDVTGRQGVN